jgi:hypothetical protein
MTLELERHTIFVTLAGSQAHGTAQPDSDVDLRGVCVAPLPLRLSLFRTFEQHEGPLEGALWDTVRARIEAHPTAARGLQVKTESVVYDVAKFIRLCADANPNALEMLFADERDWLYETAAWRRLHGERHRFLSRKVEQTYLGYAIAQLKKVKAQRARAEQPAANTARKVKRNPARAALERQYGYDTKHAMHLLRLMQSGLELLETGELAVHRPDADQLAAVRRGSLTFDQLLARAAELEARMHAAARVTALPADVDRERIDRLAYELMRGATEAE